MTDLQRGKLIETAQLSDYFHQAVHTTANEKRLGANAATLHYLAQLLCTYSRSDQVFDFSEGRLQLRPLALLYGSALEASGRRERQLWLQRLGDLALFAGGLFCGQLSRHFRDLDYCMAMGGNAYGCLQQSAAQQHQDAQTLIFGELADRFEGFVEVVAVVTGRTRSIEG